jgi:hypothetical protein
MDSELKGAGQSGEVTTQDSVDRQESTVVPARDPRRTANGPRTAIGKQRSSQNARKYGVFSSSLLLKGESKTQFRSMLHGMKEYFQPEGEMENLLVENLALLSWRSRRVLRAECAEIEKERALVGVNVRTQRIKEDQSKILGIRWNCPNSITLNRALNLLDDLRSGIKDRGFDKEGDFPILLELYGTGDDRIPPGIFRSYIYCMEAAEVYSSGGDPKVGTGVPLEKAKEVIDKEIEEEIKKLERLIPWVNDREKQLLECDEVRSLIPPQVASDHLTRIETHLARQIDRTLSQLERLQRMRLGQPVMPRLDVHVSS